MTKRMMKKNYHIFAMLLLLSTVLFPFQAVNASEQEETVPKSETRTQLEQLVQQAESIGVLVNQTTEEKTVQNYELKQTQAELDADYDNQITELKKVIDEQTQANLNYEKAQAEAFNTVVQNDSIWSDIQKKAFLGDDLSRISLVTPQSQNMHLEDSKGYNASGFLPLNGTYKYVNALKDARTNEWVDLAFTIMDIRDNNTGKQLDYVRLSDSKISEKKIGIHYLGQASITANVKFLKHGTNEELTLSPVIIFGDVDEGQEVTVNDGKYDSELHGNMIQSDGIYLRGNEADVTDGKNRQYWVMYRLNDVNNFSYTYKTAGESTYHEIGGEALSYVRPEKLIKSFSAKYIDLSVITQRRDISVTKQWVGPIGSAVTVHLYADDVDTGKTVTLNAANNWDDTFTNLRKYKLGTTTEIKYTVKEDTAANYDGVVSGDMATGFTITNTNIEKTTVKVTKAWVGTPAASATVKLLADGAQKETVTLTAADNWTHTFSNLPKYDANDGHEIVYTIDEVDIANYVKAITGSAATGFVVTNTITGKLDIPVTKTWLGTPAASVTIKLYADGAEKETVTLTATDNWTHTFTNLDKYAADGHEIVYTVDETPVAGYTKDISGTAATGFTVKNTNTATINIPVTKTWVGTAGTSATIKLLADGAEKETVTLTAADNWTHTFSNLPKFDTTDGHEIVYTVDEVDVPNYTKGISGTAATGFTVTNTITGKVSVPVTKVWVGPQASSAKVTLLADGVEKDSVTLNAANGWAHTFTNLDKYNNGTEIVYTVTEEPIANYDSVITGNAANGFTVTNTNTEKTAVDVTKTWVGTPAASVTIKLFADGTEKETVTLTAADNWTHTFANLDKYAADGHEIVYTVDETPVTDYTKAITGDAANGFTITNTITGKVNIPVTKVWVGPEATSAKVTLYADGVEKDSVTLNAANNWVHVFANLDKYNNGTEIVYTITEEPIANYDSLVTGDVATGFTVTNTNTEKVAVDVTKNWVGPATDSITIKLLADGAEVESAVITAADNWMHTFSNLPKYAADGHEIVYTVDEYDVPSYVKAIEGTSTTGFTVTNTITGKLDIPVTKVWVGPATDSVTVNLYADGVKVDTVQLTAANQWKHTFANLDKYENGREIVYTVDEVLISGYKTKITGDAQTGFTITNSKETPKTADHVNPMAYASIFVISLMAAIITMIEKKKFAR